MPKTFKIVITGRVQGVGFRPHVFNLANTFQLNGTVSNNEEGVIIFITGDEDVVHSFYRLLTEHPPVASKIWEHHIAETKHKTFQGFSIVPSKKSGKLNLQLTPDFAICEDCKTEITDQTNRRYQYPFTTCVNCGPRWAITNTFPFERDHTNLVSFQMCPSCSKEYGDPKDRRFHSQTNTCPDCGIQLQLSKADGAIISAEYPIENVAKLIKEGNIVAIKNTSGYLLCSDANNADAVRSLRKRKNRPTKPFAILYPSLEILKSHLKTNTVEDETLASPESPIVILQKKDFKGELALSELAPGLNQLGVMLPYSGILHLLAKELEIPIVATSGNIHASPIISDEKIAHRELFNVADYFLDHNLKITNPQDDSVIKFSSRNKEKIIFRRSRGLAPNFDIKIKKDKKILAMGGHLKSTLAFLPNNYLYISQYLGNLDHFDVFDRYIQTAEKFMELFEEHPEVVLVDKHPSYNSSRHGIELAKKLNSELYQIQHHKAHFASVLGEYQLFKKKSPILGVVWDGTGYGDDAQIWGGEFFSYQEGTMEHVGQFGYYDWLAGDKMAKEPRISFFSLANEKMQDEISAKFSKQEIAIYNHLKKKEVLKTSSVGRLFDAVASLLGICDYNTYEGEAAILLENQITDYKLSQCKSYCPEITNGIVPTKELFNNLYVDFKNGRPKEEIILNFIFSLAMIVIKMANQNKIKKIAMSGGVFQNTTLVDMLKELAGAEYELYFNRNLSPNDENISFGQLMYHQHIKN
ncbi:carbamoyltransferase HypF [Flagellimonas zhangzhouensis]|uniref:Carbamoyltransferase n=1 Tax=Flagellimonas zhangzhouensis TaxID=1073328 RepID=A0A1H2QE34_9FLAO|nr:carbamoyltransferase HypF [Allomuricauda zhangzhouensis]SDQ51636.1 Hydrogenase maturation protein, carbamoyltransferase HypF [Allomuricauda zhangzhouensis]SDW05068.1 hydrogenase maturation protein HypF [Allomuricauda zhangzhouensis]